MPKTICIFSDGTGQAGGDNPIHWTNVYRLYKFTREIAPGRQVAFYDPGLGSDPDIGDRKAGLFSGAMKWLSQATGLGITQNIIDCYAAILLAWEPGDRIFLFGFSRGAYTVRSLGGALALCGVPENPRSGAAVTGWREISGNLDRTRAIAAEAVKKVYQVTDDAARAQAAQDFRARHRSQEATPHFIGVWDTVRALGLKGLDSVVEMLGLKHRFHNATLSPKAPHGRQALAIDEDRETFKPELWDERDAPATQTIRQVWFAGVHSDIGGGYEDSRGLSDVALKWMIDEATALSHPLIVDPAIDPPLTPNPVAIQHDERATSIIPWIQKDRRDFVNSASLRAVSFHAAVTERFAAPMVPHLNVMTPYRPETLRGRPEFARFYT